MSVEVDRSVHLCESKQTRGISALFGKDARALCGVSDLWNGPMDGRSDPVERFESSLDDRFERDVRVDTIASADWTPHLRLGRDVLLDWFTHRVGCRKFRRRSRGSTPERLPNVRSDWSKSEERAAGPWPTRKYNTTPRDGRSDSVQERHSRNTGLLGRLQHADVTAPPTVRTYVKSHHR